MTDAQLAAYVAEMEAKGIRVTVGPAPRGLESLSPIPQPPAPAPAAKTKPKKVKAELLPDGFTPPPAGKLGPVTFVVGVQTASDANEAHWQKKAARNGGIRRAVSRVLGKQLAYLVPFAIAYHNGRPVRVDFVRLGGKRLDKMANLGASMKAVEDTVALMIGADDGNPNWQPVPDQEPGGPYGVRITLSLIE